MVAISAGPARAEEADSEPLKYQAHGEIVAHAGSDETGAALEAWVPVVQGENALLFVDGRIGATDDVDYYSNVGAGVRAIVGESVALGAYGYFDVTRDDAGRNFYGATFGAEVMTPRFELRGNYYLPATEDKFLGTEVAATGTLVIDDNELVERHGTTSFNLTAMHGVDGEVGVRLLGAEDGRSGLTVYGGGYHYWDDLLDDVDGGYGEAEYRLHGLFGEGSFLSLAGRVSDDNLRGTEVSGQVRLRIAFGKPRGGARELTGIESRMTERVRRRGTIRVQTRETAGTRDFGVLNDLTGEAFGQFFFVDGANTAGSGDPDDPTTLGDAVGRAGAGDYVVAEGGNGNIATTGVTLADGTRLVGGGGTALQVRSESGLVQSFTLGTTAGTIANGNAASDTITLGDGNLIADLALTGGANGIVGNAISGVTISDVAISDVAESGISFTDVGLATVSGSEISGGAAGALSVSGSGTVALSDLSLGSTGGTVLTLDGTGGDLFVSQFAELTILGDNGETGGVRVADATFDADPDTAAIENVDGGDLSIGAAGRVGGAGLVLDGVLGGIEFGDLGIFTDGGAGLYIRDGGGKAGSFFFANGSGTIDAIGGAAVDIDPVTVDSTFDSIASTGSPGAGLVFDTVAGSFTVTGPTVVTDPATDGIVILNSIADFNFGATEVKGFSGTGVDLTGAEGDATFASLDIEGDGSAGSKGIDLSGSTNQGGFLGTTGPSSITGVETGVDLTNANITGTFQFGDGSDTDGNGAASLIEAATPIAAGGLGTGGTYNFLDAELVGDIGGLAGDAVTVFFVDTTAGAGTASDPGTIAQAEASGADIIVLVNDGAGQIDSANSGSDDTFQLLAGQRVTGFYGQGSFTYQQGGPQSNLLVHGLAAGVEVEVEDPTGNGAVALVSTEGDALTADSGTTIDHIVVGGSFGYGVAVGSISGAVDIADSDIDSLDIEGGTSVVSLVNTDISAAGQALHVADHDGALSIDANSSISSSGSGYTVYFSDAGGTYTIDAGITLTGGGMVINPSPGTFDFNGALTITNPNVDALLIVGPNGPIEFGTVDIVSPGGSGIWLDSTTGNVTFGDVSVTDSATTGGYGLRIEDQTATSTISFAKLDLTYDDATGVDAFSAANAAGTITVTAGAFSSNGDGDIVDIDGGSATITIGASLTDTSNTGLGNGIEIGGVTGGAIAFNGNYTRTGAGDAVSISSTTGGTITFGGSVTVSGGSWIDIASASAVAFNGAVSVTAPSDGGVHVTGTNGTISFVDLDVALTQDNTVGLGLNGATFTGAFTAKDFDVTSTSATGTIGVDLRNASGAVRLGDTVANGGASASISGVATGVRIDNTSDVTFTFGDGENAFDVASVIDVGGTAVDFGDNDGTVGSFNFVDVDWNQASNALSYQNLLSDFTIYYIDAEGDGNGSAANPGNFGTQAALDADVLVLVNQNASGADTIDLLDTIQGGNGTFQLTDGQGLFSFNGGEQLDLAQYGYSMGGAPSNFHFTAISGTGTLIDNPGAGTGAPVLTTSASMNTITVADGAHVVLAGLVINSPSLAAVSAGQAASLLVDDSALTGKHGLYLDMASGGSNSTLDLTVRNSVLTGVDSYGLYLRSSDTDVARVVIADSEISGGDTGLSVETEYGGTATLSLSGLTVAGGNRGITLAAGAPGSSIIVKELDDIAVTSAGSIGFYVFGGGSSSVLFDADPETLAIDTVVAGNITLGTAAAPLAGAAFDLSSVAGAWQIGNLQAHTTAGSALLIDNASLGLDFTLSTLAGDVSVANGDSGTNLFFLNAIDADLTLDTVSLAGGSVGLLLVSVNGAGTDNNALTIADLTIDGANTYGLQLSGVAGAVTITDGAIGAVDDPAGYGVLITTGTGDVGIGADITKTSAGRVVDVSGRSTGTVTFSGALSATGDFANGIYVHDNTGGTVNFTGPATLSTGTFDAIALTTNAGAAINFSGGLDIDTTTGRGINASNGGTLSFTRTAPATNSITTTGGPALSLTSVTIGNAGATFDSIDVTGGSSYGLYFSNVGQTASSTGIDVLDGSIAMTGGTADAVRADFTLADIYVGADLSTATTAGHTVNVANSGRASGQTIEFAGLVDDNGTGIYLDNNDQNGGYANLVFSGTIDIDTVLGAAYGLYMADGGNLSVTGPTSIDTLGMTGALFLQNNAGNTITFNASGDGLDITTEAGIGINGNSGGTLSILGTGNSITTATGKIISLSNMPAGTGGINFASLAATGTVAGSEAILLNNLDGTSFSGGTVDIAGTGAGWAGIHLTGGSAAAIGFGTTTIANTGGPGIQIDGTGSTGAISFDSVTIGATGAASSAIYLNGSTGTIDFGDVELTGVGANQKGIEAVGTFAGAVTFDSLGIALNGANAIGVDLSGAVLDANITATDFDLTSVSTSGTIGIDLRGATGTGTVRFGDTDTGGESATIADVATGVFLNDASAITFIFGDGENTVDVGSSIAATTAIDFTDATGANGTFNFLDVTFPTAGSTGNLESSLDVYWIDAAGNGNGSKADPGNFAGAAGHDVLVLANTNDTTTDTIDLASTQQNLASDFYTLTDGQILVSFYGGDTIDLTDFGLTGGGAPGNLQLTGLVTGGTTLTNPYAGFAPKLDSSASVTGVIWLDDGSTTWIDGVHFGDAGSAEMAIRSLDIDGFTLTNSRVTAGGWGILLALDAGASASTATITIRDTDIISAGTAALISAGTGDDLTLNIENVTSRSNGGSAGLIVDAHSTANIALAIDGLALDGGASSFRVNSGATGDFVITEFNNITAIGGGVEVSGRSTNEITFDADPSTVAIEAVSGGNIAIGMPGTPVSGFGLNFFNVAGRLDFGDIDIWTDGDVGLTVNNDQLKAAQPTLDFTLTSTGGTINSSNAAALYLDPLTIDMTLDSVSSSGGANGILIDDVAGTLTILAGSISGVTTRGVDINASTLDFAYAGTISNVSGRTVEITGQTAGTVTFSGAIDDNGSGINLNNNTGATINFTGGLDIDSGTSLGFSASNGGTINLTGMNTIDTTSGRILDLNGVIIGASGVTFASLSNSAFNSSGDAIRLSNVDGGTFSGGTVNSAGAAIDGIWIGGGSAATFNFGSTTIANTGDDGIEVNGAGNGTVTFSSVTIDGTTGNAVEIVNSTGSVNINGGSIGGTDDPSNYGAYIGGGTGDVTIAANIYKTTPNYIVVVDDHETGTVNFTGNISATGGNRGIYVANSNSGTINFTGQTIYLETGIYHGVSLTNDGGATINFNPANGGNGLDIITTSGVGFLASNNVTLTVTGAGNTIETGTGKILDLNNATAGTGGINFASLTATGTVAGTSAISLYNLDGTTFSGGTVNIAGSGSDGISIGGGSAATIDFGSTTIGATTGDGINIYGAGNGPITFSSVTIDNTGGDGVEINGSDGTVNINGGSIGATNDPAGRGVYITGGTGNVSIAASIKKTTAGKVVEIDNHETGTVTFSGDFHATGGVDNGILVQNSNSGTINFTGKTIDLQTGASLGVYLHDNTGGTINFNPTAGGLSLDIITTSGTGFLAIDGGTVTVLGADNTIGTTTGGIINLQNISAGTGGINFASLTSTGTVPLTPIYISNLDGSSFSGGTVNIAGTSGGLTSYGVFIGDGSAAMVNFGATTIANTSGSGIGINGAGNGTITFSSVTINNTGSHGVEISGNTDGAININGGSIGATTNPAGKGVYISGGTGNIAIGASIKKTNAGNVVDVTGRTGGTVTFSGDITATGAVNNGIYVHDNTGGTVNFTGQTINIQTGGNTGVNLTNDTGAAINFNSTAGGSGLDITTTTGTGFNATGGGTVTVQGSGNTITSGTGTALNIVNTNIGAAGVTFQSISSSGGTAPGIILDTTGSAGGLHVTGNGTNIGATGGGVINNKTGVDGNGVGNGIYLNSTADVQLNGMLLQNFSNSAIRGYAVNGFQLTNSTISGTVGDNSAVIEGAIAFGDVLGVGTAGLTGNSLIDNVNISGSIEHQIEVYNQTGTAGLTIRNSNIHDNSTVSGSDGIQIEIRGTAQLLLDIANNQFSNNKSQAIQVSALEQSNLQATIRNNTITKGTQGNEGIVISNGGDADARVLIANNTISGFDGTSIFVGQAPGQGTANSLLEATISNNTVISPVSATNHAILAFLSSQTGQVSQTRLKIDGNTVSYNSGVARAILVDAPDSGRTPNFYATVTNNTVTATDPNALTMISVAARNGATGHADVRGNDVNYTAASGITGVNVREASGGSMELARGASVSNDAATVLAANNPDSTTGVLPTSGDVPVVENNTILQPATPTLPALP